MPRPVVCPHIKTKTRKHTKKCEVQRKNQSRKRTVDCKAELKDSINKWIGITMEKMCCKIIAGEVSLCNISFDLLVLNFFAKLVFFLLKPNFSSAINFFAKSFIFLLQIYVTLNWLLKCDSHGTSVNHAPYISAIITLLIY